MKWTRRSLVGATLATSFTAIFGTSQPANAQSIAPAEAQQIATDAYVYGYSLITTDVTRVQMSNVPKVEGFTARPGNSSTFRAIRRPTIVASLRLMRTHFIRWYGSTSLNRRCSATRIWAIGSICSR